MNATLFSCPFLVLLIAPILILMTEKWATEQSYIHIEITSYKIQYTLDLRKPDLRKNLDLRKIGATTDFLVHKLFDLRKIF